MGVNGGVGAVAERGAAEAKAEARVITAHVPIDLARRVDELAERLQRSRGWIVKQALAAWVEAQRPSGFAEAPQPPAYPAATPAGGDAARVVDTLKLLRERTTLGEVSWQELRDAGRR